MADDNPGFSDPVTLFQDVEDLKAQIARLTGLIDRLTAGGGDDPAGPGDGDTGAPAQDADAEGEEEDGYPPFILLLDSPAYDEELRALIEWVEGVLVPGYLAEPSSDAHWCHLWFEHPVAVGRLHALWLAWQELTEPATCGYTGPSTWHRDHLDPCMRELRGRGGPFGGCTKNEHQIAHRQPSLVPSAWRMAES
ncbi:DUF4913 domain-containing protein [Streptomyces sp. NPDC047097]|uniref:DUF4913 domain-containing protein n=1 Tax=Streptomyces sp. NPDC047097 TaxID=3155260 RepID=UPI0033FB5C7D